MPVMNGMDFYEEAVKTFSDIKERIIFFTGSCEERCLSFFRENNLRYLAKPSEPQDREYSGKSSRFACAKSAKPGQPHARHSPFP